MQGDGPLRGDPIRAGVLVVSRDPVAADVTSARLMGMDPEKIEYLMEAGRFLGQSRSELIEQRGRESRAAREVVPAGARLRAHRGVTATLVPTVAV